MEFIPAASRRFRAPRHLNPLVELLERAGCERTWACTATPPRHGKTETLLHGIAWMLLREPRLQIAYISYAQRFAEKKSRKAREIARAVGVPLAADMQSRATWLTGHDDGGVSATGIRGQLTGDGFHVMIIDDPVKGRATAESAVERDAAWDWLQDDALTRLEPNGSVIVNMARWHPDDVAGRLVQEYDAPYINLPAIDDQGNALWPERYSVAQLNAIREHNEYGWNSLYMGAPRGRGQRVFGDTHFASELPEEFQSAIGLDFAYSAKKHADFNVALTLARAGDKYFVLDVQRGQMDSAKWKKEHLVPVRKRHHGVRMVAYVGAAEQGVIDLLNQRGQNEPRLNIEATIAGLDKFVRAQPVATAWNAGKIFLPENAPWADDFVDELKNFTGVKDKHDDQVDALAAAFDALAPGAPVVPRAFPTKFDRGTAPMGEKFTW